jgi:hypothetical protein
MFALFLVGCSGLGWLRVSPDGRYTTVVVPVPKASEGGNQQTEEGELELRLYELQTGDTIPLTRFDLDNKMVVGCQWSPDSTRLTFLVGTQSDSSSEFQLQIHLFDMASRELTTLPMEAAGPAIWSRDGWYLLVASRPSAGSHGAIHWYRVDDWSLAHTLKLPRTLKLDEDNIVGSYLEWGVSLSDNPFTAIVHLSDGNLYRIQQHTLTALTTTGDVRGFWVAADGSRLRWVRMQEGEFLAVFERNLTTMAVRRLILVPSETVPLKNFLACRFSPSGELLAWADSRGLHGLHIRRAILRTFALKDTSPSRDSHQGIKVADDPAVMLFGFDWRGDEMLVVQWGGILDAYTFRSLLPPEAPHISSGAP